MITVKSYLGHLDLLGKIILNCVLKKGDLKVWTGLSWLRIRSIGGFS
jgi:hypothetical protein